MMPVPVASRSALAVLTFLALFLAVALTRAEADAYYSIRNLGTLPRGGDSVAFGLNNLGQVFGVASTDPVIFEPNGRIRQVSGKGFIASGSGRHGINGAGLNAGNIPAYRPTEGGPRLWSEYELYDDINNRGEATGSAYFLDPGEPHPTPAHGYHALLARGNERIDLGTLGGYSSHGFGINEAGHVVGVADLPDRTRHAFLYKDGEMIDLAPALGISSHSWAAAINDRDQIAANSEEFGAILLDDQGAISLSEPGSVAWDLNNAGEVVGKVKSGPGWRDFRAFVYRGGEVLDLNDLIPPDEGWILEEAVAINEHGQIAGTGMIDGNRRAFLLTPEGVSVPAPDPIPEPAPIALLGLAAGWAVLRRRGRGRWAEGQPVRIVTGRRE